MLLLILGKFDSLNYFFIKYLVGFISEAILALSFSERGSYIYT